MTPEQLKASILQYAMQGKLVPQNPEDEPASILLEKIKAEKEQLIAEGKIKKEKALPEITEEEKPFDIPESWEWVRIKNIYWNDGQEKPTENFQYIDVGSIDNKKNILSDINIIEKEKAPSRARKKVQEGDVIYSSVRPYLLNTIVVPKSENIMIASTAFFAMRPFFIRNKFLLYVLKSPFFTSRVSELMKGLSYPAINDKNFNGIIIPIPPLEEQQRIIEKIEELLPLIDQYGEVYKELEQLNAEFPNKMEQSLLQYAMEGKLVPQISSEEPAKELLKRIHKEKEELIAEGKIKKEKALPAITEEEKPFDIPDTWEWVRLGELAFKITDGAHHRPHYTDKGIPFLSVKNMSSGKLNFSDVKYISEETHNELFKRCDPVFGDLLLTKVGTTGVPIIVDTHIPFSLFVSVALVKFSNENIYSDFLLYMMKSPLIQKQAKENTRGVGNKNWVLRDIKNTMVVIPPLEEQKRIVSEIEKSLLLINW